MCHRTHRAFAGIQKTGGFIEDYGQPIKYFLDCEHGVGGGRRVGRAGYDHPACWCTVALASYLAAVIALGHAAGRLHVFSVRTVESSYTTHLPCGCCPPLLTGGSNVPSQAGRPGQLGKDSRHLQPDHSCGGGEPPQMAWRASVEAASLLSGVSLSCQHMAACARSCARSAVITRMAPGGFWSCRSQCWAVLAGRAAGRSQSIATHEALCCS